MLTWTVLGLTIFFGCMVVIAIAPRARLLEVLGMGYPVGIAIVTLIMFYLSAAGLQFSLTIVAVPVAGLTILVGLAAPPVRNRVRRWLTRASFDSWHHRLAGVSLRQWLLVGLLLAVVLLALILAMYWPPYDWDELAMYDFLGQVFFAEHEIHLPTLRALTSVQRQPLLESLGHTWFYMASGSNPHILYWLFLVSLLLSFYALTRSSYGRSASLVSTLLLAVTPIVFQRGTVARADLPAALYLAVGCLCLHRGLVQGEPGDFRMGAVLVALTAWARRGMEAHLLLVLIVFAALSVRRRTWWPILFLATTLLLVELPWWVYWERAVAVEYVLGLPYFLSISPDRVWGVLAALANKFVDWEGFGLAGLLFLMGVLVDGTRLRRHPFLPVLATLLFLSTAAVMYVVLGDMPPAISVQAGSAALLMPIIPLITYWSAPVIVERLRHALWPRRQPISGSEEDHS